MPTSRGGLLRSRRRFLATGLGLAGVGLAPVVTAYAEPKFGSADPFTLGVASGYPHPAGVVLWTRLAPEPLAPGGGMPRPVVEVEWELSERRDMRRIVRRGRAWAAPEWAHSVHVEVDGLEPGREYWYRFTTGDAQSPIGRTRTAPAYGQMPARLRLAIACCQMYEHGYFGAYSHMVEDDLDLILHLGDYIYTGRWGGERVRSHGAREAFTLDDYRARYALYRMDPHLQRAHAMYPWLVIWDDHEVANDYADELSEDNDPIPLFLARRAAAYRAYYEHMPLPRRHVPFGAHARLYTTWRYGSLAHFSLLDSRQYRSPQLCPRPGQRGSNHVRLGECPELVDPERTLLGRAQNDWLRATLSRSNARWTVLGQQTLMAHVDQKPGPGQEYWTDGWNGYPAARDRLLRFLDKGRIVNPVVLGGDIHAFVVANLNAVARDPASRIVASELVTSSLTSQPLTRRKYEDWQQDNANMLYAETDERGYVRIDIGPDRLAAELVAVDALSPQAPARRVLASYVVEDGRPGPIAA